MQGTGGGCKGVYPLRARSARGLATRQWNTANRYQLNPRIIGLAEQER